MNRYAARCPIDLCRGSAAVCASPQATGDILDRIDREDTNPISETARIRTPKGDRLIRNIEAEMRIELRYGEYPADTISSWLSTVSLRAAIAEGASKKMLRRAGKGAHGFS